MVRDGIDGLLYEPRDHEDLVACLRSLVLDADARHRLGEAARRTVAERSDLERTVDAYATLLTPADPDGPSGWRST
jgi:glycosyltransferase involved in cell wall biosynthesis